MKKTCFVLTAAVAVLLSPSVLAAEHHFGLRVGNTNFEDDEREPSLPAGVELQLRYIPPGCMGPNNPVGCPEVSGLGGQMDKTKNLLNDGIHLDELIDGRRTLLDFRRDFDAEEFDGTFIGFHYEFRRDAESHWSLAVDGGVYSTDATHVFAGNAYVDDPINSSEDPGDYDNDGNTGAEDIPANITDRLEYTVYFANVQARYNWTPGRWRLWVGAGAGLWANLWREVIEAEYLNIICNPISDSTCNPQTEYSESDGDRRTIIPLSAAFGATWQFLPHWSVHIENRFLFLADSNVTMFQTQSEYDIGGNQVILGFSYKL
jgi:hypothetical protein